jgi:hypothetical protein
MKSFSVEDRIENVKIIGSGSAQRQKPVQQVQVQVQVQVPVHSRRVPQQVRCRKESAMPGPKVRGQAWAPARRSRRVRAGCRRPWAVRG